MIEISSEQPFARGGNRLCYRNPINPDRCIKVRRPDFSLKDLRQKKGFPKTLIPLKFFDDNLEEFDVINKLYKQHGKAVFQLISRCYGFIETDLGQGLELELIRDDNGQISQTLKAQLWLEGYSLECKSAVERFCEQWRKLQIPSRDLLPHNLLVQKDNCGAIARIVVVDGIGSPNLVPFNLLPKRQRSSKVERKLINLHRRIEHLLDKKKHNIHPGNNGMHTAHYFWPDQP